MDTFSRATDVTINAEYNNRLQSAGCKLRAACNSKHPKYKHLQKDLKTAALKAAFGFLTHLQDNDRELIAQHLGSTKDIPAETARSIQNAIQAAILRIDPAEREQVVRNVETYVQAALQPQK